MTGIYLKKFSSLFSEKVINSEEACILFIDLNKAVVSSVQKWGIYRAIKVFVLCYSAFVFSSLGPWSSPICLYSIIILKVHGPCPWYKMLITLWQWYVTWSINCKQLTGTSNRSVTVWDNMFGSFIHKGCWLILLNA